MILAAVRGLTDDGTPSSSKDVALRSEYDLVWLTELDEAGSAPTDVLPSLLRAMEIDRGLIQLAAEEVMGKEGSCLHPLFFVAVCALVDTTPAELLVQSGALLPMRTRQLMKTALGPLALKSLSSTEDVAVIQRRRYLGSVLRTLLRRLPSGRLHGRLVLEMLDPAGVWQAQRRERFGSDASSRVLGEWDVACETAALVGAAISAAPADPRRIATGAAFGFRAEDTVAAAEEIRKSYGLGLSLITTARDPETMRRTAETCAGVLKGPIRGQHPMKLLEADEDLLIGLLRDHRDLRVPPGPIVHSIILFQDYPSILSNGMVQNLMEHPQEAKSTARRDARNLRSVLSVIPPGPLLQQVLSAKPCVIGREWARDLLTKAFAVTKDPVGNTQEICRSLSSFRTAQPDQSRLACALLQRCLSAAFKQWNEGDEAISVVERCFGVLMNATDVQDAMAGDDIEGGLLGAVIDLVEWLLSRDEIVGLLRKRLQAISLPFIKIISARIEGTQNSLGQSSLRRFLPDNDCAAFLCRQIEKCDQQLGENSTIVAEIASLADSLTWSVPSSQIISHMVDIFAEALNGSRDSVATLYRKLTWMYCSGNDTTGIMHLLIAFTEICADQRTINETFERVAELSLGKILKEDDTETGKLQAYLLALLFRRTTSHLHEAAERLLSVLVDLHRGKSRPSQLLLLPLDAFLAHSICAAQAGDLLVSCFADLYAAVSSTMGNNIVREAQYGSMQDGESPETSIFDCTIGVSGSVLQRPAVLELDVSGLPERVLRNLTRQRMLCSPDTPLAWLGPPLHHELQENWDAHAGVAAQLLIAAYPRLSMGTATARQSLHDADGQGGAISGFVLQRTVESISAGQAVGTQVWELLSFVVEYAYAGGLEVPVGAARSLVESLIRQERDVAMPRFLWKLCLVLLRQLEESPRRTAELCQDILECCSRGGSFMKALADGSVAAVRTLQELCAAVRRAWEGLAEADRPTFLSAWRNSWTERLLRPMLLTYRAGVGERDGICSRILYELARYPCGICWTDLFAAGASLVGATEEDYNWLDRVVTPGRVAATLRSFPDAQRMQPAVPPEGEVLHGDDAPGAQELSAAAGEETIDIGVVLPLICEALNLLPVDRRLSARRAVESGALALALRALACTDIALRTVALSSIASLERALERDEARSEAVFRERPQQVLLIAAVRSSYQSQYDGDDDLPQVSAATASALAHASLVLGDPKHPAYRSLNKLLLSRQKPWNLWRDPLPVLLDLLQGGGGEGGSALEGRTWAVEVLGAGISGPADLRLLSRRHVPALLASYMDSPSGFLPQQGANAVGRRAVRCVVTLLERCSRTAEGLAFCMGKLGVLPLLRAQLSAGVAFEGPLRFQDALRDVEATRLLRTLLRRSVRMRPRLRGAAALPEWMSARAVQVLARVASRHIARERSLFEQDGVGVRSAAGVASVLALCAEVCAFSDACAALAAAVSRGMGAEAGAGATDAVEEVFSHLSPQALLAAPPASLSIAQAQQLLSDADFLTCKAQRGRSAMQFAVPLLFLASRALLVEADGAAGSPEPEAASAALSLTGLALALAADTAECLATTGRLGWRDAFHLDDSAATRDSDVPGCKGCASAEGLFALCALAFRRTCERHCRNSGVPAETAQHARAFQRALRIYAASCRTNAAQRPLSLSIARDVAEEGALSDAAARIARDLAEAPGAAASAPIEAHDEVPEVLTVGAFPILLVDAALAAPAPEGAWPASRSSLLALATWRDEVLRDVESGLQSGARAGPTVAKRSSPRQASQRAAKRARAKR